MPISAALERLLREHTHIALVIDAQGRHSGLVTLDDIVEELLGDIQDEYDLLPIHVVRSGAGWLVGGGITLHRLKERNIQERSLVHSATTADSAFTPGKTWAPLANPAV